MKTTSSLFVLSAVAGISLLSSPLLRAQTSTTTTTTTTAPGPGEPAVTTTKETTVTTTTDAAPTVAPLPGQHVAEILLTVSRGSVEAYFGNAARGEKVAIGDAEINIKLPSRATVTKIVSRDGDSGGSTKVTADNPWRVSVPFDGPGRFVFNISDWDDATVTSCVVKIDGQVIFSGRGSEDEFKKWAQTTYAEGVKRTGDREIAFFVAGPNR